MKLDLQHHYRTILASTERRAMLMLSRQIETGPNRGGHLQHDDGLAHPSAGVGSLSAYIPLFVSDDSSLAGSKELAEGISMALDFAHGIQRPDGTFDLLTTNLMSSPDTGFIMHNLVRTYRILKATGRSYPEIEERLYELIVRAGDGIIGGGFHTPNHRWVNAAALSMAYNVTGKYELIDEAKRYLGEGIDIDENGEFTERSAGAYNTVNDNALMILAEELDDPTFLDPVAKNLEMMFSYIEPDGSVFTWNSTRQDNSEGNLGGRVFPTNYYPIYLGMLSRRFDPRYAWIVDTIFTQTQATGGPGSLFPFMLEPELKAGIYDIEQPSTDYARFFESSKIARMRRNGVSATILAGSSSFLIVQAGALRCRIKLCASFFSKAQFKATDLHLDDGIYKMRFESHGDYRLPLDPAPDTPMWRDMDHGKRVHVKDLSLIFEVEIREITNGVSLMVRSTGCDRVPVKLEMIVSRGATIKGENFVLPGKPGGSITVETGSVTATTARDQISIGPGFATHWFTESMRGSNPQSSEEFTVYFTDYTPIERTVEITGRSA
jgi:hypothetical protein